MLLTVYRAAFTCAVITFVLLFPLWLSSAKRRATLFKRLGWQRYPRRPSPQKPLWIHALSIGELLSAESLIRDLRRRLGGRPLFLSVSTASAFSMAHERFSTSCDGIFYFPFDVQFAVERCLKAVDPALIIVVETDIWPGFLDDVRRKRIPCILVNGRLSPESFKTYRRLRILFEAALNIFDGIYPQSAGEAARFVGVGVTPERLRHQGNLKFDAAAAVPDPAMVAALRAEFFVAPDTRMVIAGSTHWGEEEILRSCFLRLRDRFPALQLLIVPRRPERGSEVLQLFRQDGIDAALASELSGPRAVIVVDRMGYLSRLYALADVAVVGGSFVPQGGQNPIEPAACGKPVLFGPDMHDFPDIAAWLLKAGGAIQAANERELYDACRRLLLDPEEARIMGERARAVVAEHQGTTERIVQDLVDLLGRPKPLSEDR
ncbi:MAG TPA: glycosyltransferase N-terminal domain-containing protein [Nitrospira sp.]|nr:glycosyltransferase N-terminal domain-containing protein [Nitrospira sp.]